MFGKNFFFVDHVTSDDAVVLKRLTSLSSSVMGAINEQVISDVPTATEDISPRLREIWRTYQPMFQLVMLKLKMRSSINDWNTITSNDNFIRRMWRTALSAYLVDLDELEQTFGIPRKDGPELVARCWAYIQGYHNTLYPVCHYFPVSSEELILPVFQSTTCDVEAMLRSRPHSFSHSTSDESLCSTTV